jgi:hypothetical protein
MNKKRLYSRKTGWAQWAKKGRKRSNKSVLRRLFFFELGYTRASMQDICMKSGLSKIGLYRRYEDITAFYGLLQLKKKQQNVSYLSTLRQYRF